MKPKIKRKPPGRPWHKPATATKVCLLCLRRYHESLLTNESSDEDEDDEQDNNDDHRVVDLSRDPLGDDVFPSSSPSSSTPAKDSLLDKTETDKSIPKKRKLNLYLRFLTFLSRHLQIKTKRFRHAATKNELSPPFCEHCRTTVKGLCDMYTELNNAKLALQWRLMQIGDTIKCSKLKISGKMGISLVKSLSTQLHVSSSNVVDIFRKQVSVKSSLKSVSRTPKVSIHKDSCLNAMAHKLKYPMDQIKQYMVSLIVIFALALPPKPAPKKKNVPSTAVDKYRSIVKKNGSPSKIKKEIKAGARKENVPPNVKIEPGVKGEENSGTVPANDDDDNHSCGGGYSPPNSGPNSPANNSDDEEKDKGDKNDEDEEGQKNSDSDWSMKGGGDDSGSDVEFSVRPQTARRWNLRRRRTRATGADNNDDDENDEDFIPGVLPPLRAPKGSNPKRPRYDDSEKQFKCNLCSRRFRLERTLKRHLGEVHSLFMQHKCPHCDLKFKKVLDLKIHKKRVHLPAGFKMGDQLPYKGVATACTVCHKEFPSRLKMTKHRKSHKLMDGKHTCEICGKVVIGKFRIDFHMKTHNRPDKPHHCKKCPRSFATQEGLDLHIKLHEQNPDWVPWVRKKIRKADLPAKPDGPHKCQEPDCGKSFFKPYNLQIHMALHASTFSCSVCEKVFTRVRDLRRHLNKFHETKDKVHFCVNCDKAYTIQQTFDLHKTIQHPSKGKLPCDDDYCLEEFDDVDLLREHLKTHLVPGENQESQSENSTTAENPDKTDPPPPPPSDKVEAEVDLANPSTENAQDVTEETAEEKLAKDEQEAMKPGIYTCERCNWSFSKKLSLTLHKLMHTPKNEKHLYQCTLCDKGFAVVDTLQTHHNRLHGPKIKPYLCLQCGVRFHRKESFLPHMKMHEDRSSSSLFECVECDTKCKDSQALKKHMRAHDADKYRKCDECGEGFSCKMSLNYHKHLQHGMEKPIKCDVEGCGKGFFNQYQLNDHKICHTEATFQCPMCPKKFRRSHNLTDHILVHKQEKNHICDFCGKAFVKKSSLNLHLAIHRGEKKFKCPHCPKAFCRKFARDCHIRTHTKETPFTCHICGRNFGQYTSMKNHLKVHMKLNSTVVVRRPFKKTLAAGEPLLENLEEGGVTSATTDGPKFEVPTASGIIHEALQAAFQDISMDLESTVKVDDVAILTSTAPIVEEQTQPKEEDEGENEDEESEVEAAPVVKRRRGRRKKAKNFICGICGKAFVREKPYATHVERHLNEEGPAQSSPTTTTTVTAAAAYECVTAVKQSPPENRNVNLSMPQLTPIPVQMPPNNGDSIHPLALSQQLPPPVNTMPQQPVAASRKSNRRGSNKAPGSRLAQIVEDVIEAATNNQHKTSTNVVSTSPSPNAIQNHFHQESNPHQHQNFQQNHHHHIQSPPHHLSQPNSERSTPTGSNHNSPSPIPITSSIPSAISTVFPSSSFLSPFLYANPYLLPRAPQQGEQLGPDNSSQFQGQGFPGFSNSIQNRQQPHHQQQQQQFQYQHNGNPIQYQHNVQQHGSHRSPNDAMPKDLSKSGYNNMFYGNPR
ncbi:unnamed protein product [Orchesella dallaii]|uniref:C2H2-type domain-containing protein n=1 Tax=Orchesella dallaii TaxID=48710 RepID=A0ABP1QWQ8_9HEXA